ncbi:DedA family protein [Candidatus Peregrinibacteria bacterium]|nr:DedA family protein [Candidatus Peregrinibacteria bacterium]
MTKRKIIRIIGYLVLACILALFAYTILFYEDLKAEFYTEIQLYGSIALFVAGFIVDTIGGPLGPEVPVIGGLLAGIKPATVVYMAVLGSATASLLVYSMGYFFGEYGVLHYASPKKYKKWRRVFIRYRRITMSLGALTPVPYVTVCLLAGVFRVKPWEFIAFTISARIVRILGALYIVLLFQGIV